MANLSTSDLVRQNFVWRIESQTPTSSLLKPRFTEIDPLRLDADQAAGVGERSFSVYWLGSEEDNVVDGEGITDNENQRIAEHRYRVDIYYTTKLDYRDLQHAMLQDRHDITRLLRSGDNIKGYNADNSSTELGLFNRIRESDELIMDDPDVWVYRATWRCTIEESEN